MTGIMTLDSITALLIVSVVLSSALGFLAQPKGSNSQYLYQVSGDILSVLEMNGGLRQAVRGDDRKITEVKSSLPSRFCFELAVYENQTLVYSQDRGCASPKDYMTSKRSVTLEGRFYIAQLRVWLR